jgi:hypothetical protein
MRIHVHPPHIPHIELLLHCYKEITVSWVEVKTATDHFNKLLALVEKVAYTVDRLVRLDLESILTVSYSKDVEEVGLFKCQLLQGLRWTR